MILTNTFKDKFQDVLRFQKGSGYWIWKFDIIQQELEHMNEGYFLVYTECNWVINNEGKNALTNTYPC